MEEEKTDLEETNLLDIQNIDKEEEKEKMEIHQHQGHHQGKRSFKSYLYEFFMLFLAVSAGFLVENIREKNIEKHREAQFIESLIRDLETDTASLTDIVEDLENKIQNIDTLIKVMQNPGSSQYVTKIYSLAGQHLSSLTGFTSSDKTISQLKNSGGMRLIQQAYAADSIAAYYEEIKNIDFNTQFLLEEYKKVVATMKRILDFRAAQDFSKDKELKLILENKNTMTYFYNDVLFYSFFIRSYIGMLKNLKIEAAHLIEFLKLTYEVDEG